MMRTLYENAFSILSQRNIVIGATLFDRGEGQIKIRMINAFKDLFLNVTMVSFWKKFCCEYICTVPVWTCPLKGFYIQNVKTRFFKRTSKLNIFLNETCFLIFPTRVPSSALWFVLLIHLDRFSKLLILNTLKSKKRSQNDR